MALANNSRPSAALTVGAAVVATPAHNTSAAAHATNRPKFAGGIGTVAPLLRQLNQANNNHKRHTVNFDNTFASVGSRLGVAPLAEWILRERVTARRRTFSVRSRNDRHHHRSNRRRIVGALARLIMPGKQSIGV